MSVSPDSTNAYHSLIKGDLKENGQDNIIHAAFVAFGEPATTTMIQKYLENIGINYSSGVMSRSVNNLHGGKDNKKEARIVKTESKPCKVTGVKVAYYEAILKLKEDIK
jgi:hypothetical protein